MSDLRPPSYEVTPTLARPPVETLSGSFSIGRVLARSFGAVRRQWLTLVLLTYGLGFLPRLALTLGIHSSYRHGHDNPSAFAISAGRTLAIAFCLHFARAAVTSAVVKPGGGAPRALASTLAGLPALAPMWLASEYYALWSYWNAWSWSGDFRGASTRVVAGAIAQSLAVSLAALVIALASAAAFGVVTPVVLAERLSLWRALRRCWTLMRGARWRVLALYVLASAVLIVFGFPAVALRVAAAQGDPAHVYAVLGWVQSAVYEAMNAMLAVVLATAYLELVRRERGALEDEVADVFA